MNKIIGDVEQVRRFIDLLPEAKPTECYFLSLSARNKYLTEEERESIGLGRTEMFHQQIIQSKDKIIRGIRRCETHPEAFLTKTGVPIPEKIIVCYMNLFCSDSIKALEEFNSVMNRNMVQLANNAIEGKDNASAMRAINKANKCLIDCYQRSRGSSTIIDVDFDIPDSHTWLVGEFLNRMFAKGVKSHVIRTKSGFHVLLERATLKHNYNADIQAVSKMAVGIDGKWEIVKNDNLMVPVPGTYQGGHLVHFVEV